VIAGPFPESNRIVRSWPGALTGETCYETEDGRVWRDVVFMPTITGVTYGSVEGSRVVSPPRSYQTIRGPILKLRPPPEKEPEIRVFPRPAKPKGKVAPTEFVGAGSMRRRWR
jgi:hypothetical protein